MFFRKVLREIFELGYSVRWALLCAADYGVPQKRKRLFIIASWLLFVTPIHLIFSSPGQELPDLPRPTHAVPGHPYLPPHVNLRKAFANIDPTDRLHEKRPYQWPRSSDIVPSEPLHATVTCGVDITYWDETRPLTKRELARIQSFPDSHVFGHSQVSKQSSHNALLSLPSFLVADLGSWECCSAVACSKCF